MFIAAAPASAQTGENEFAKVLTAAQNDIVKGPQDVKLSSQAVLHLPEGKVYIPQPHAAKQQMQVYGGPRRHRG